MWKNYKTGVLKVCPQALIVHDKYHLMAYLNKAVNTVRRKEHFALLKENLDHLKRAKYIFLKRSENLTELEAKRFSELSKLNLKVSKAYLQKELFRGFFDFATEKGAQTYFNKWERKVIRQNIPETITIAKMFRSHFDGLISYIKYRISNGVTEGLNSVIQTVKANAKGFRNFENYRIRILFVAGKLDFGF